MIYNSILETIGNTPMVCIQKKSETQAEVLVKVESQNPGGSIKDRIAYNMVIRALEEGRITKDSCLIEPTSGNTGIGLAMVCAVLGMRCIIVMPENMSKERIILMKAYGAQVVLSPKEKGMAGAIAIADKLHAENEGSMILQQFDNPDNPASHRVTAQEILTDCDDSLDVFVAAVGTGGTLMGTSKVLKETCENLYVCAVEPYESALMSTGVAGGHKIQGIGANFVPSIVNVNAFDEILTVKGDDAIKMTRWLAQKHGILAGISSGCNVYAALQLSKRPEFANKRIVTVLPDTGERYISSGIFE